jgi:hypothetical protein
MLPPPPQWAAKLRLAVSLPRCRHRRAAAKLPLTSRCHAAATAAATALLPPRCHHRAVRRRRSAAAKLPPTSAFALPPPPQLPRCCRCRRAAAKLPPTSRCRAAAAPPFVGWLLRCCPPSNFVIACRHATINALVAGRFRR